MRKINGLNRILLIDDDEATNFIHATMIQRSCSDVQVQVVHNGREALDYLTCSGRFDSLPAYPAPDIIILDINMPAMDGWEFMEEYNKLPDKQRGKMVRAMLTTGLSVADQARASTLQMHFLNKPLSLQDLEDLACRCVNSRGEYFPLK